MIHLEPRRLAIVRTILSKYPYAFYAFGSRVKGTHKQFSDLDICVMGQMAILDKCALTEEFEDSNLPFTVDVIEWDKIAQDFQELIQQDLVLLSSNEDSR